MKQIRFFRHRILPSFFAESEGLDADDIISHILEENFTNSLL